MGWKSWKEYQKELQVERMKDCWKECQKELQVVRMKGCWKECQKELQVVKVKVKHWMKEWEVLEFLWECWKEGKIQNWKKKEIWKLKEC
jgi:hypothetical protein